MAKKTVVKKAATKKIAVKKVATKKVAVKKTKVKKGAAKSKVKDPKDMTEKGEIWEMERMGDVEGENGKNRCGSMGSI